MILNMVACAAEAALRQFEKPTCPWAGACDLAHVTGLRAASAQLSVALSVLGLGILASANVERLTGQIAPEAHDDVDGIVADQGWLRICKDDLSTARREGLDEDSDEVQRALKAIRTLEKKIKGNMEAHAKSLCSNLTDSIAGTRTAAAALCKAAGGFDLDVSSGRPLAALEKLDAEHRSFLERNLAEAPAKWSPPADVRQAAGRLVESYERLVALTRKSFAKGSEVLATVEGAGTLLCSGCWSLEALGAAPKPSAAARAAGGHKLIGLLEEAATAMTTVGRITKLALNENGQVASVDDILDACEKAKGAVAKVTPRPWLPAAFHVAVLLS